MQTDPVAEMDLTSDQAGPDPSPSAKVARLARKRRAPKESLDLAQDEDPTAAGRVIVDRLAPVESSRITVSIWLWRVLNITLSHDARGDRAAAASLLVVVLSATLAAGLIMPVFMLPPDTPAAWRILAALTFAVVILWPGVRLLNFWLRKKP